MKIVDLHADTINRMQREFAFKDPDDMVGFFLQNSLHIDLQKLSKGQHLIQTFALWTQEKEAAGLAALEIQSDMALSIFENYHQHVKLMKTQEDLRACIGGQNLYALLSLEDMGPLGGHAHNIQKFFDKGVRMMSLTWNHENAYAYPNGPTYKGLGLKRPGFEALEMMADLGIVIDISHLSDQGSLEVIEHAKRPIVASHSNTRQVWSHQRNLTDPMIKALANKGGIVGVNFFSLFIDGTIDKPSDIFEGLVKHLRHIINVGGIEAAAIGTDFDGMPLNDIHISDSGHMQKFVDYMDRSGFKTNQIEAICNKNAIRLLNDNLK